MFRAPELIKQTKVCVCVCVCVCVYNIYYKQKLHNTHTTQEILYYMSEESDEYKETAAGVCVCVCVCLISIYCLTHSHTAVGVLEGSFQTLFKESRQHTKKITEVWGVVNRIVGLEVYNLCLCLSVCVCVCVCLTHTIHFYYQLNRTLSYFLTRGTVSLFVSHSLSLTHIKNKFTD